jgi:ribonucleoside-diphosphate reductase alpha chain
MKRPVNGVWGETPRIKTGCGFLYITDNTTSEYQEVFFKLGKTGGCAAALLQALAVVTSLALRAGVPKKKIMDKWKGIGCPNPMWDGPVQILSCPDAIAQALQDKESGQQGIF